MLRDESMYIDKKDSQQNTPHFWYLRRTNEYSFESNWSYQLDKAVYDKDGNEQILYKKFHYICVSNMVT